MSTRATKTPSIPNPSKDNIVDAVGNIKDLLDVREGRSGDPLDANVTYRDLKDLGLAEIPSALSGVSGAIPSGDRPVVVPPWINKVPWTDDGYDPTADLSTPPTPTNLIAGGAYSSINLSWTYASYRNHAYTEIYRSAVNDITTAVLIGTNQAPMFNDPVGTEKAFYYWVRNVSMANVRSEFNSASGAYAATALDVERRISEIEKQVLDGSLAKALETRVIKLEASNYAPTTRLEEVRQEVDAIRQALGNDVANVRSALYSSIGVQGSNIIDLQLITTTQASRISALGTRMGNAESSIVNIQRTNANQAYSITGLESVVNDPNTGLEATRATLTTSYYTKAETDSAIASADLALQTSINSTLTGYVTNSYLTSNYYTKSETDSSIANADLTLNTSFNSTLANYATTAYLNSNFYTQSDTDFALSQVSNTLTSKFNNTLAGYVTTAQLTSFSYSKAAVDYAITTSANTLEASIATVSASVTNVEQTKIGYATLDSTGLAFDNAGAIKDKAGVDAWNLANPGNLATWNIGLPFATAVKQVSVSDGASSLTLEQRFTAQKSTNDTLNGQYTVKIDNNGFVSGFGLASTTVGDTPTSEFVVRADRFAFVNPSAAKVGISSLTASTPAAVAVSSIENQATVTIIISGTHGYIPGDTITINGVTTDTRWNTSYTVSAVIGINAFQIVATNRAFGYVNNGTVRKGAGTTFNIISVTVVGDVYGIVTTSAAHGLSANQNFRIAGVTDNTYWNNDWVVFSVTSTTEFKFIVPASLASPGTGTTLTVTPWGVATMFTATQHGISSGQTFSLLGFTGTAIGWNKNWKAVSAGLGTYVTFNIPPGLTSPASVAGASFSQAAVPFVIDGNKTYIDTALIRSATITSAQIASLAADKITAGTITATLDLQAATTRSGAISFGQAGYYLGNDGGTYKFYVGNGVTGTSGRYLSWNGSNFEVRGTIYAEAGYFTGSLYSADGNIGGCIIGASSIYSSNYVANTSGWSIKNDGTAEFSAASIRGQLTASQINTNNLTIKDGSGTTIFSASVPLNGAYIADLAVSTLKIAGDAVTVPVSNVSSSSVTISTYSSDGSTDTWYDIVTLVVDYGSVVSTAKGLIGFTLQHQSGGGGYWAIRWRVVRGDETVIGFGEQSVSNNDIGKSTVSAVVFDSAANSGARTYKVQIANWGNIGSARVVDSGAVVYAIGAKR